MDIQIKKTNQKLRKALTAVIIILATMALTTWAIKASRHTRYTVDRTAITIDEVTEGSFNDFIRITGQVETAVVVQVSALETGIVEHKWVEEGASVREGDVIVTLRNPLLRQQILDSESQLAEKQNMLRDTEIAMEKERLQVKRDILSARTELSRTQRAAERLKTLYDENLTSREEYLSAREDCELARENLILLQDRLRQDSLYRAVQLGMMRESLRNMRENFTLVRQRADNLEIRASHSGQLGNLDAQLGQNIVSGQQIGQINILDNYKISVKIDEHYIDRITTGLTGTIERQGRRFDVRVSKVYPEVIAGQFRADLVADSVMPERLRVGQSFAVELQLGEPTMALMVPRGSFLHTTGGKWAYVLDADGTTARRREISIGRQNPQYYEVLDGLSPGERIITSSYTNFNEMDEIIINYR